MKTKAVFPGKYIQGEGVFNELSELCKLFGKKALLLASPSVKKMILPSFGIDFEKEGITVEVFRGECCEDELNRLTRLISQHKTDVIIGMGGGKTIDTAKIAADRLGIAVIVVPTIASTDAPCSGCAVTYTPGGAFETVHYQKMNPAVVLVDTNIIANAPTRFLVSGMGDALATWFEARSCGRTQSMNECGGLSTLSGLHIAELCYNTLLKYGVAAKMANDAHLITPSFNNIVEANILLSGIGFESSGLATAHSVHNGLTALEETHAFFHGEKVAFGVLTGLHLNGSSPEEIDTVYAFCEQIGLPTTFSDIGLKNVETTKLWIVAQNSCAPDQPIHHEAGIISPRKVLDAMIMADAYGKHRKS